MMLASTVQFSKYGRSQPLDRRVPRLARLLGNPSIKARDRGRTARGQSGPREDQRASVPSGPNSVLGQAAIAVSVPSCKQAY